MSEQKNIPTHELEDLLTQLQTQGKSYLNCVKIVKDKYKLGLREAGDLVVNSQAFAHRREDIIRGQQEAEQEIFEYMMERNMVKSITLNMSPDQTTYEIEIDHSQNQPDTQNTTNEE